MKTVKNKGLGRGLDALLGSSSEESKKEAQGKIATNRLIPGKYQPRTKMDPTSLEELAASIRAQGLMQPILVRPLKSGLNDEYEIIAGERRWRAAQMAGLSEVPVLIREIPDESALAMALIENIQREDLNPLEEAQGLQRLIDEFSMTHQEAADAVGRSRPTASNLLRLLQLSAPVQEMLMDGKVDMGHARALLPLNKAAQVQIAQRIFQKGLSVRDAEKLAKDAQKPEKAAKEAKKEDRDVLRLEEELSDALGAKVAIVANQRGAGKIQINFENLDELAGILQKIRGES